mmetsp:Transcript_63223/g.105213  ORF Transcript_63223/g.105213 Transcript_63223/m.105213 type:complete len:522 (+) Transcript_63223:115-1680(+)
MGESAPLGTHPDDALLQNHGQHKSPRGSRSSCIPKHAKEQHTSPTASRSACSSKGDDGAATSKKKSPLGDRELTAGEAASSVCDGGNAARPPRISGSDAQSKSFAQFLGGQLGCDSQWPLHDGPTASELQQRREGIYNFFQVPLNLEPFLMFGYLACLESFVQQLTFLPLRMASALLALVRWRSPSLTQKRDLLRGLLILLSWFVLLRYDMSQAYHNVRNQSTMKLYVVFNVLEIFDKLCSSFGQDILESLYRAGRKRSTWGMILDFVIAFVYINLHTLVLFYQSVALNVAVNSHNNVLLTLLISNNFTELKANVFKRCESENLFQVSCSDAVERFQLSVYLLLVLIEKLVQTKDWSTKRLQDFGISLLSVYVSELFIDWIKHAFITKFNRIRPDVYSKFMHILCCDTVANMQWAGGGADEPLAAVSSRMGFVPIPLLCLVLRVSGNDVWPLMQLRHWSGWLMALLLWLSLCALKVFISIVLLGFACLRSELSSSMRAPGEGKKLNLEGVGRFTLYGKQIV